MSQRNFALLWVGGLVSYIGNWAMLVALPLVVYQRTGSALASGLIALIRSDQTATPTPEDNSAMATAGAFTPVSRDLLIGLQQVRTSAVVTVVFAVTATALLGDAIFSALLAAFTAQSFPAAAVVLGLINAARGGGECSAASSPAWCLVG